MIGQCNLTVFNEDSDCRVNKTTMPVVLIAACVVFGMWMSMAKGNYNPFLNMTISPDRMEHYPDAYKPRPEAVYKYWDGNVHSDCVDSSMVALTFDDGCNEGTERVLRFLKRHSIRATFFVLGSKVNEYTLAKMVKEGHVIGSHSWDHPSFVQLSDWDMKWQLQATDDAIYQATGKRPMFFRPPFGEVDWRVSNVVNGEGYQIVNWNVDSNDWHGDPYSAASQVRGGLTGWWRLKFAGDIVVDRTRNNNQTEKRGGRRGGFIVLQHDAYFQEMVGEAAIEAARERGLRFVPLDECLGIKPYRNQREWSGRQTPTRTTTSSARKTTSKTQSLTTKTTTSTTRRNRRFTSVYSTSTMTKSLSEAPKTKITRVVEETTTERGIPPLTPLATLVIATPVPVIFTSTTSESAFTLSADAMPTMRWTVIRRVL